MIPIHIFCTLEIYLEDKNDEVDITYEQHLAQEQNALRNPL